VLLTAASKDEWNHPPLAAHAVRPEFLYIPLPSPICRRSEIYSHKNKSRNDGPVEQATDWRCDNRDGKVNQTFDKIVRADQTLEHWMLRHAVLLQGCQICMAIVLYTGSKDEDQAAHKSAERWRLDGQV
jgi:hypothetical protein